MKRTLRNLPHRVLLTVWLGVVIIPYLWMLVTSLKSQRELYVFPVRYWPAHPTLAGFAQLFQSTPFPRYMLNSFVVATGTCVIALTAATAASYALSRLPVRGKRALLFVFLTTQLFPAILLVIPLFVIMRSLHLLNTYGSLILADAAFAVPFSTWLMTGFFNALPHELDEAATIDGCGRWQAFRYVLLPLVAPGFAAAGTYIFLYSWNEFIYALTFTADVSARTIPVGLQTFMGEFIIRWDLLMAGGVITAVPVIVLFMFVQRELIAGLTAGAVKG
ncbi:MAG TPA: carbohydrate ABC transporter permease [bacterium]|nr:carbohydrate ABC transporter permease [bacterium]